VRPWSDPSSDIDSPRPPAGRGLLWLAAPSKPHMQPVVWLQPLFPSTFVTGWSAATDVASSQYGIALMSLTAEPFQVPDPLVDSPEASPVGAAVEQSVPSVPERGPLDMMAARAAMLEVDTTRGSSTVRVMGPRSCQSHCGSTPAGSSVKQQTADSTSATQ